MGSPSNLSISHYKDKHKQAGAILGRDKETVRQGGRTKNEWKGKVLVVLAFGVPSDMTRIEFKRKCDEVGLYCFARRTVEKRREKISESRENRKRPRSGRG